MNLGDIKKDIYPKFIIFVCHQNLPDMKRSVSSIMSTVLALSLFSGAITGCGTKEPQPTPTPTPSTVSVTGVSLNKTSLSLLDGSSETLTATVSPENASNKSVSWKSSVPDVATVDGSGKVTALKAGSATVTVTTADGGKTASCSVTVTEEMKIVITGNKAHVPVQGGTAEFPIQYNISYTIEIEQSAQDWLHFVQTRAMQSGTLVFSVDANTGEARTGKATVKDNDGKVAPITLTFEQDPFIAVSSVQVTPETAELESGKTLTLTATVLPADATDRTLTWKSDNEYVATVSEEGVVTAKAEGTATITASAGEKSASCAVTVLPSRLEIERAALVALYKATDGDNWKTNDNWCSGKPVDKWYGVQTDSDGSVIRLRLEYNNLSGSLPPEIGNLSNLEDLRLMHNNITGLPEEIGNLSKLSYLDLRFAGSLGQLPSGLGSLNNLEYFDMYESGVRGKVPSSVLNNPNIWDRFWSGILHNNEVETAGLPLPVNTPYDDYYFEKMEGGSSIRLLDEYASNKYTVMYNWAKWCPYSTAFTPELISIYNRYHSKGLQVIGYCDPQCVSDCWNKTENQIRDELSEHAKSVGMPWNNYFINYEKGSPAYSQMQSKLWPGVFPAVMIVDHTGNAVFAEAFGVGSLEDFESVIAGLLGDGEPLYESTDYSADGKVKTIQKHSTGNGIKLVFTGDAFSDKDISDGKFDTRVDQAVEAFFREEPYKSMRDRFDVYSVTAVSKNGEISVGSETAFSTVFSSGSGVDGNRRKVFEYASKIPGIDISKATINVIVNSSHYGGICYMYSDNSSISFTPVISFDDELFAQCVSHETAGHGFAKLKDEYDYGKPITEEAKAEFLEQKEWGWGANVDIVGTASQIQWSFMLKDSRYKDYVGIYEGALTFGSGAWRPTFNSIMRFNTDGFNAPSRFAIFKRIIELSEGRSASFEEFASFDAKNLKKTSTRMMSAPKKTNDGFVPFATPVVIKGSWRD